MGVCYWAPTGSFVVPCQLSKNSELCPILLPILLMALYFRTIWTTSTAEFLPGSLVTVHWNSHASCGMLQDTELFSSEGLLMPWMQISSRLLILLAYVAAFEQFFHPHPKAWQFHLQKYFHFPKCIVKIFIVYFQITFLLCTFLTLLSCYDILRSNNNVNINFIGCLSELFFSITVLVWNKYWAAAIINCGLHCSWGLQNIVLLRRALLLWPNLNQTYRPLDSGMFLNSSIYPSSHICFSPHDQ